VLDVLEVLEVLEGDRPIPLSTLEDRRGVNR
jgi:hypothetical protein